MKLADIAISLADVLSCMPRISQRHQLMRINAAGVSDCLAAFLFSIPNSVNPRLGLLQEKISGKTWSLQLVYDPQERDENVDDSYRVRRRKLMANTNSLNAASNEVGGGDITGESNLME
jgi:hypothetical protein